jgi:glyoxylase-like metal-dependent hydrolase (beta-lactamase superfamily II)
MASGAAIHAFFHEPTFTVTYLVIDPATRDAAIIDPVLDYDAKSGRTRRTSADLLLAKVKDTGAKVRWILETHVHADHISAAQYLKQQTGAPVAIGTNVVHTQRIFAPVFNATDLVADGSAFDRLLNEGDRLPLGQQAIEVWHTPGHTPACATFIVGDAAFIGDTMFMPDYGTARCDFPGGDAAQLYRSLRRILSLPTQTRLFLCHDYKAPGRDVFAWETTVAEQRAKNIHVHDGIDEAAFVAMRTTRDRTLDKPVLILPSVQVNMRAGHFPPPESDGHVYLKVPLDRL